MHGLSDKIPRLVLLCFKQVDALKILLPQAMVARFVFEVCMGERAMFRHERSYVQPQLERFHVNGGFSS